MKNKFKICSLLTLLSSFGVILGYLVNYNQVEVNNEICFNGIRAIPFENRYSNSDLTGEPKQSDFFSYNYRYMGTGGTSLSNSTIWNNYRGETASGVPVVVAVIDSGIDIFHEDFIIQEGLDVNLTFDNIEQYSTLHPKSAHIYDRAGNGKYASNVVTDVGIPYVYETDVYDSEHNIYSSHGTAVSSTIASAINGKGGFGVAPMAQIMFIKMDFYFVSISVAIKYAADNGADIINLSFGAYAESFTDSFNKSHIGSSGVATALTDAIDYAHSKDVVVVAAAGNEDTYRKSYPACNDGVIGVGALEEKSATKPAYYTNYNSSSDSSTGNNNVDVVAPGRVYTAQYPQKAVREEGSFAKADSYYSIIQGTSFASPLTAGAIALYRGAHPGDSRTKVIDELFNSCDDIGDSGWDAQYGHGRVNLTEFVNTGIAVTEVNISPSTATLNMTNDNPNPTVQLSASFLPSDADDEYKEGLWISNDDSVATVDENTGLVTAVGKGQTDITFITERDMIEGVCTVTVTDSVVRPVTGISLDQTSMTVGLNKTRQLTATITPTNASNQNINWTTSNSSVATVDNGLVFGKSLGTATITATTQDGNFIATCDVTVEKIQGGSFTINIASHTANRVYAWQPWTLTTNGIPISGKSYIYGDTKDKMQFNNSQDAYYIYNTVETPDDISKITIYLNSTTTDTNRMNWSVRTSTSSFGEVPKIPNSGTCYSAQKISTSGTSFNINGGTYFAICYEGSGATYLDSVVVEYGGGSTTNPDSISLNESSLSLEVDETATLIATATGEVSWESDDTGVATVSDEGLVTAKNVGSATITATCGTATAKCTVTVIDSTPAPVLITNIELTGNFDTSYSGSDLNDYDKFINLDVYNNKTQQINVSYTPSDATNKSVSWVSSDSNIVSVSNGLLTAKGEGSAVITVTTSDGSNISKTIKVTVTNQTPVLTSISVSNIPETVKWRSQFDTSGIIVTANYIYGDSKTVSASFSGIDTSTIGEKEVTATYTEGGITKTTKFEVFVTNKDVERNEIPGESSTYGSGDFGTSHTNTFTSNGQKIDINGKGIDWTINTDTTYFGHDANNGKGAQIGSGKNPCDTATISSSDFDSTITSVIVEASIAKDGNCTIAVYVGGVMFNPASKALTVSNTTYEFTGSAKGEVKIIYTNNAAKAVYFRSVSVTTSEPGGYDWSGDDQATSYITYLKTFSSCASSWTDRNDIVRLVNEFNYMIQESKNSALLLEKFTDNGGYSTSSLDKLKMIVNEYNNTLQEGETALSLVLSVDEQGNPIFFYEGENKTMILNINTAFNYFALIGVGLLCLTGFIVFKKSKQN